MQRAFQREADASGTNSGGASATDDSQAPRQDWLQRMREADAVLRAAVEQADKALR